MPQPHEPRIGAKEDSDDHKPWLRVEPAIEEKAEQPTGQHRPDQIAALDPAVTDTGSHAWTRILLVHKVIYTLVKFFTKSISSGPLDQIDVSKRRLCRAQQATSAIRI